MCGHAAAETGSPGPTRTIDPPEQQPTHPYNRPPRTALYCRQVLYKLDKFGNGEEVAIEELALNTGTSFVGFDQDMFVAVRCLILCGLFGPFISARRLRP